MGWLRWIVTALVLAAPVTGWGRDVEMKAGDRCVLQSEVQVRLRPRGRGKVAALPAGQQLEILEVAKRFVKVSSGKQTGYVDRASLARRCRPPAPTAAAPAAPSSPEPTAERAAEVVAESLAALPPVERPAPPAAVASGSAHHTLADAAQDTPAEPSVTPDAPAPESREKVRVAVMNIRGGAGVDQDLLTMLTTLIPAHLDTLGPFKSISSEDIRQMLAMEAMKQALGCDDVSCLAEIGGAVGAEYMLNASISKLDSAYMLQAQLVNIRESKVEQRVSREYSGDARGLVDEVRTAAKFLVRDILARRSGTLRVNVSEEGATIKIDGTIVGVSPMDVRKTSGGIHTVSLEKTGFVVHSVDVDIFAGKETVVNAALTPSLEFKQAYASTAKRTRYLAYSSAALGLAGIGGGLGLYLASASAARELRRDVAAYNERPALASESEYDALSERRKSVAAMDLGALVSWGVGVVALAAGTVLFATGDDPGRYDADLGPEVAASAPLPDWSLAVGARGVLLRGEF